MVVVDAKIRNAFFSCSATYLTKFFTDLFNFSRVPDKLRPNKNDESLSCLDPSSVDQDIPKVNSHHPTFYGAPTVPCIHVFGFISPISAVRGHHVLTVCVFFNQTRAARDFFLCDAEKVFLCDTDLYPR